MRRLGKAAGRANARPMACPPFTLWEQRWWARRKGAFAHPTALHPRRFAQGVVDAVLPARTALLEVLENILVDPQRNQFLHAGKSCFLRRSLRHLGGGFL